MNLEKRNEKAKIAGGWRREVKEEEMKRKTEKKKRTVQAGKGKEGKRERETERKRGREREYTDDEADDHTMAVEGRFKPNFYGALAWAKFLTRARTFLRTSTRSFNSNTIRVQIFRWRSRGRRRRLDRCTGLPRGP